jgi:hypothetical protein
MTQARRCTTCRNSKKCGATDMHRLKRADWIALRLLYVLLAADPSASSLPDVRKTVDYYEKKLRKRGDKKYARGKLLPVFSLLNKEIANDDKTFNNPEVKLTRDMDMIWKKDTHAGDSTVAIDDGRWRPYGNNT